MELRGKLIWGGIDAQMASLESVYEE